MGRTRTVCVRVPTARLMAIKILHIADVHLDSPFTLFGVGEAEKRRMELRAAFSSAVMFAKENGVKLCLIAGDLFDSEYITRDGADFISSTLKNCPSCDFYLAPGNHDPASEDSVYSTLTFPENLHIFKGRERLELDDLGVTLCGVGFTDPIMTESPVSGWYGLDPDRINILVCHGDTSSSASPCGPVTEDALERSGFDYVALGHIHKPSGVLRAGNTSYCYPGCLVGRSYDEAGYHGAMYGTIDKGNVNMRSVCFSPKRYETVECDLTGCGKYDGLDKIRTEIADYRSDTLLRLILTGVLTEGFTVAPAEIGVGDGYPSKMEIIDKTTVKPQLSALENDVSLKGVFYRRMQERSGLADGEDVSDIVSMALKYGLSALEDRGFSNLMTEDRDE